MPKRSVVLFVAGLASLLTFSSGQVFAQCSGGRGGGSMATGSTVALNSSLSYSPNALVSNYPSSIGLMAQQYQQRAAQELNQLNAMAYQNAQRQRMASLARQAKALPYRLARAEAKRAAREERIAARIAERDGTPDSSSSSGSGSGSGSSNRYLLTSTTAK